jgi:hypothetical protein
MSDDDPFGPVTEDELDAARVQLRGGEHTTDAPERIYLQWDGDGDLDYDHNPPEFAGVTWAAERVFDGDIEYVRKDKADALAEALEQVLSIYDAHIIETTSCDRDGNLYCDCLEEGLQSARGKLAIYRGKA